MLHRRPPKLWSAVETLYYVIHQSITLNYIILRYIYFHCIALHYIELHHINRPECITLQKTTLYYIPVHIISLAVGSTVDCAPISKVLWRPPTLQGFNSSFYSVMKRASFLSLIPGEDANCCKYTGHTVTVTNPGLLRPLDPFNSCTI